jgi:hypothetical protein
MNHGNPNNNINTPLIQPSNQNNNDYGMPEPPTNTFNYDLPKTDNHYPDLPQQQWNPNQNNQNHNNFPNQQFNPNPGFNPNMNQNMNPGMNPNMNQNMNPGMNHGMNPNMNPNMNPGMNPNMNPGMNQNMNHNMNPNMYPNMNQNQYKPVHPNPPPQPQPQPKPQPQVQPNIIIVNNTSNTRNPPRPAPAQNYYDVLPRPMPAHSIRALCRRCRHIGFTTYRRECSPVGCLLGIILLVLFFPFSLLAFCICYGCIMPACQNGYHYCSNCRTPMGST